MHSPLGSIIGEETGIEAIGNTENQTLPHESASINVLFGVSPGIDDAQFIADYVNPSAASYEIGEDLIAFMEQYDEGSGIDTGLVSDRPSVTLTLDQAWTQFQALPAYVQQSFAEETLFAVLTDVGTDYNNPSSPYYHQYARGYQAINTLFPASYGYTSNSLTGGLNGANKLVQTGNLDIASSTIQTQQGGNVTILGPGGEALVGSSSAPPSGNSAEATEGILTLENGDIDIFTDRSLLLAQSRVFTEQGGAMTIWSSNGDINAGKGATTAVGNPAPIYVCDDNMYCTRDARGEVTGAGIATLQTIPGATPGDIYLEAPRGTVDAGAAGIRFSGNLFIAAYNVANAAAITGSGTIEGISKAAAPNIGALTSANNTAGAAANAAADAAKRPANTNPPSVFIIEILGYGGGDGGGNSQEPEKKKATTQASYNPNSAVQFVAMGNNRASTW